MGQESMTYDVVIVGAGPAGLSAAIYYATLCHIKKQSPNICVIEKGRTVGAHILSGAIFEPQILSHLIPNWQTKGAPLHTKIKKEHFFWLSKKRAYHLPIPRPMKNHENFIISLGNLCQWLAEQAEALGVEIYSSFSGTNILFDDTNKVIGVATGDVGRDKHNIPKSNFQPGIHLLAKQTLLAEGCRGSLSQQLIHHYNLQKNCQPQIYGIGLKEIWEISPKRHIPGYVMHSIGWPLKSNTYGGGFIYHIKDNKIACGFIMGLDYKNPYLSPFEEFQRFKQHPKLQHLFKEGRCLSYGSRAINEGGFQSIPSLCFPGGLLIGDSAGFVNIPKLKGIHTAMNSGMIAAQVVHKSIQREEKNSILTQYNHEMKKSPLWKELYLARNIRPSFRWGLYGGMLYSAFDTYILRGHAPWTFSHYADHLTLKPAKYYHPINYEHPDEKISFDRMTATNLSNVYHEENQPCHLLLTDPRIAIKINYTLYNSPESRYCPAGVYEIVKLKDGHPALQINASNCIHCKTCDIKDPTQNITWVPPEGGGGPNYNNM